MLVKTEKKSKILYGSDPESFAGKLVDGKLYATPPYWFRHHGAEIVEEDERHPVFIETGDFKVHEDGAAFEMTIRPSFDSKEMFDRVQAAASAASEKILSRFPDECLPTLQFIPTINWDVARWANMPKDFFMSTQFGCDPHENVFDLEKRAETVDAKYHPFRYAGGHLHFSGSILIAEDPHQAVRCEVITAGIAAIHYSTMPELEVLRTFYGFPGNFRVQNYGKKNPYGPEYAKGIEYRTPSATWAGNWEVAKNVLRWAEIGIVELLDNGLGNELVPQLVEPAIAAITNADQKLAGELLSYIESKL